MIDLNIIQTWYAAVTQCFFSLSVGFGPIVMFSSYNPFRHNIYRHIYNIRVDQYPDGIIT